MIVLFNFWKVSYEEIILPTRLAEKIMVWLLSNGTLVILTKMTSRFSPEFSPVKNRLPKDPTIKNLFVFFNQNEVSLSNQNHLKTAIKRLDLNVPAFLYPIEKIISGPPPAWELENVEKVSRTQARLETRLVDNPSLQSKDVYYTVTPEMFPALIWLQYYEPNEIIKMKIPCSGNMFSTVFWCIEDWQIK